MGIDQHLVEGYPSGDNVTEVPSPFHGNDKPAYLAVRQVREGAELLVGVKWRNSTSDLTVNDGPTNASWNPAFPDPPPPPSNFPYWAVQAFVPIMCVCCPAIAGCIRST